MTTFHIGVKSEKLKEGDKKLESTEKERKRLLKLKPLLESPNIMFWRPQKVGSSTVLSLLVSYGYRYNALPRRKASMNSFCRHIAECVLEEIDKSGSKKFNQKAFLESYKKGQILGSGKLNTRPQEAEKERLSREIPFQISLTHELCNMPHKLIDKGLSCAFSSNDKRKRQPVKEIFLVREPLARALSVYYFWGELFKLKAKTKGHTEKGGGARLGGVMGGKEQRLSESNRALSEPEKSNHIHSAARKNDMIYEDGKAGTLKSTGAY